MFCVGLVFHIYVYVPVPPEGFAVIEPSANPQFASVLETLAVNVSGSVIVTDGVDEQPALSVTTTV